MNPSTIGRRLEDLCASTKVDIQKELRRLRTPEHLVDDLTEEVFEELLRDLLARPDGPTSTPPPEVSRMARRARDRLRSGAFKWEALAERAPGPELRAMPPDQEAHVLLKEVLQRADLTPEDREILRLAFFEGLTSSEIAARLGKKEDAVSGLKYRAIAQAAAFVGTSRRKREERREHIVRVAPARGGAPATHRWSARLGSGLYGWSTAVDREGSLLVAGWLSAPAFFGGARLESPSPFPWKLWLVRIRRDRPVADVMCLACAARQHGQSITLDEEGHLVVAAYFTDAIEVGGGAPEVTPGGRAMAVLLTKIDVASLRPLWQRVHIIGPRRQRDHSLVTDARGNIVVSGLVPEPGSPAYSLIVRRFNHDGQFRHGWEYLHTGQFHGWSVTAAGSGLLVTGVFDGSIDFGGGHQKRHRRREIFLAKLGASGQCEWLQSYRSTRGLHGFCACADLSGTVSLAGYFGGTIDFGNTPLKSRSDGDVFVARLDASGNHMWSKSFPERAGEGRARRRAADRWSREASPIPSPRRVPLGLSIAPAPDGGLFLAGNLNPGDGACAGRLQGATDDDISLAKLSRSGACLWCVAAGRGADAWFGNEIAADAAGGVLLSVYIQGTVTLGERRYPASRGEPDLCVMRLQ